MHKIDFALRSSLTFGVIVLERYQKRWKIRKHFHEDEYFKFISNWVWFEREFPNLLKSFLFLLNYCLLLSNVKYGAVSVSYSFALTIAKDSLNAPSIVDMGVCESFFRMVIRPLSQLDLWYFQFSLTCFTSNCWWWRQFPSLSSI